MCGKLPYCARKVDPCMQEEVRGINEFPGISYRTVASCCGHGIVPATIVVHNVVNDTYFEWYSGTKLNGKYKNGKTRKRWYVRRGRGKGSLFYISEVMDS